MGRPDKLDDDIANHIVDDIRGGMPMRWAAVRAGISERTLFRWMADAEAAETLAEEQGEGAVAPEMTKYRQFRQRVLLARAAMLSDALEVKRQHLKHKNPKISGPASTFVLTQMFSSDFSSKSAVELSGPGGAAVPVAHSGSVQVGGSVELRPLLDRETLRELTRAETEAALAVEAARLEAEERDEDDNHEGGAG
jgi:hypothetical protein